MEEAWLSLISPSAVPGPVPARLAELFDKRVRARRMARYHALGALYLAHYFPKWLGVACRKAPLDGLRLS